jgi:alcohol dehydrogenase, propanol-preferring
MVAIPKVQTAAIVTSKDEPLLIKKDHPVKQPEDLAPGECLIKLHATGVCHSGNVFSRFIVSLAHSS